MEGKVFVADFEDCKQNIIFDLYYQFNGILQIGY